MKQKPGFQWLDKLGSEQRKALQVLMVPLIVIILIIVIRIADRPKAVPEETEIETDSVLEMTEPVRAEAMAESLEEMEALGTDVLEPGVEPETEASEAETEAEEPEDEFATEDFRRDGVPEILDLMKLYFQARRDADPIVMNQIYGVGEQSESELEAQRLRMGNNSKYVQDFENVATYVMDGTDDHSWLVYSTVDINFYLAKTRAPMLLWCYVTRDGDGSYRIIDNSQLPLSTREFIDRANRSAEVRRLAADVNRRLAEALNSDENLKNVYGVLRDGSPVWDGIRETEAEVSVIPEGQEEPAEAGAEVPAEAPVESVPETEAEAPSE